MTIARMGVALLALAAVPALASDPMRVEIHNELGATIAYTLGDSAGTIAASTVHRQDFPGPTVAYSISRDGQKLCEGTVTVRTTTPSMPSCNGIIYPVSGAAGVCRGSLVNSNTSPCMQQLFVQPN